MTTAHTHRVADLQRHRDSVPAWSWATGWWASATSATIRPRCSRQPRLTRSLVDAAASSRAIDDQVRSLAGNSRRCTRSTSSGWRRLKPDLIITQAQCDVCAVRYDDVQAAVRNTPSLAGTQILALNPDLGPMCCQISNGSARPPASTSTRSGQNESEPEALTAQIRSCELSGNNPPRVICLEWIDPPMLAANWTPELVQMAGGSPGLTRAGGTAAMPTGSRSWTSTRR